MTIDTDDSYTLAVSAKETEFCLALSTENKGQVLLVWFDSAGDKIGQREIQAHESKL